MRAPSGAAPTILAASAIVASTAALAGSETGGPFAFGFLLSAVPWLAGMVALVLVAIEAERAMRASRIVQRAGSPHQAPGALDEAHQQPTSIDDQVRMLGDTLKLAGVSSDLGLKEPVELTRLIADIVDRTGSSRLSMAVRSAPLTTLASTAALRRTLSILIENALANGERAAISCDRGTSSLVVHVDDDGPGVSRDRRPHIFEWRYYMATPPAQQIGCRVELVIAHSIVRALGGELSVSASPLGGARLTMRLALAVSAELELAAAS